MTTTEISMTSSKADRVSFVLDQRAAGLADEDIRKELARATYANSFAIKEIFAMADDPEMLAKWELDVELSNRAAGRKAPTLRKMKNQINAKHSHQDSGWTCRKCGGPTSVRGQICGEC